MLSCSFCRFYLGNNSFGKGGGLRWGVGLSNDPRNGPSNSFLLLFQRSMSAAHRVSSTSVTSQKSTTGLFRVVQIDGLVALKIIKHFEQSGGLTSATPVQGVLLGLMDNETLEITNCFPFPADEDADVSEYQREMIKKLRKINVDQLTVGFYQSSVYGFFITRELIEDMYVYQTSVEESVCLIYGLYFGLSKRS